MEVSLHARSGVDVPDDARAAAERKLAHLEHLEPRAVRAELEVGSERGSRSGPLQLQLKAALWIPRKTFRAEAESDSFAAGVEAVVDKLERQVRDHHSKRKARVSSGPGRRVQSAPSGSEPPSGTDADATGREWTDQGVE